MYVVIWKYQVKSSKAEDFEQLYGEKGDWVEWFKQSPNYVDTELIKSVEKENEYVSIDRWQSKKAYDEFYDSDRKRFEEIDQLGDSYTLQENLIGCFVRI